MQDFRGVLTIVTLLSYLASTIIDQQGQGSPLANALGPAVLVLNLCLPPLPFKHTAAALIIAPAHISVLSDVFAWFIVP
jgi:hypothetical protein